MTGMGTTTGLLTFEEFERLPDHDEPCKLELLDGELIRMPPAFFSHMQIAMRVYNLLKTTIEAGHAQGQILDLGQAAIETGCYLGGNFFVPDVSVTHAGQSIDKYPQGAPALAVEVISESNTQSAMHRKVLRYFEHGAREVWVLYPDTQSVAVHIGDRAVEVRGVLATDLFPGLSIDLTKIFI